MRMKIVKIEKTRRVRLPKLITAHFLRSLGACPEEIREFKKLWPSGARFTRINVLRALKAELTPYYLAEEYLKFYGFVTEEQWEHFGAAISRLDNEVERAVLRANRGPLGSREKAVESIRSEARIKEAELLCALWKQAKPEVRVFKRED